MSNKPLVTCIGMKCPKCDELMERRTHSMKPTTKIYYTQWDLCKKCKHLQHYKEFRVINS